MGSDQLDPSASADPREEEAALSELQLVHLERVRLENRIVELETILERIYQRIKGKTQ